MRIKKILITSAIALLSAISIVFTLSIAPVMAVCIPAQNEKQYENAITEKMDRLKRLDKENCNKVVIIGGSSTAFGFQSELIEEYLGKPVVNLGTYASLGTKLMLDLAENYIKKGDIVIISPEMDRQTLSTYFSSYFTLRAIDGNFSLLFDIPLKHWINLYGASWDFAIEKMKYLKNGTAPDPKGVYNADNFNEYGDIEYERRENEMFSYYNPKNNRIELSADILDAEFTDYLNSYYKKLTRRGADVYFYYCPMNKLSVEDTGTYENRDELEEHLKTELDIPILGSIDAHIMEPGYFYNSNFHLNEPGARMNTILLIKELFFEIGNVTAVEEEIPEPPALPERRVEYEGYDANSEYFTFAQKADKSYMITGVKQEYWHLTELTVPCGYNGYVVSTIGRAAFEGSSVDKLIIPRSTNLTDIMDGAFAGASDLSGLYIYFEDAERLPPPLGFGGVDSDFKLYFEPGSTFQTDYYWRELYEAGLEYELIK